MQVEINIICNKTGKWYAEIKNKMCTYYSPLFEKRKSLFKFLNNKGYDFEKEIEEEE